jgi:transposase
VICGTSSAQTRDDARVNEEREEAQVMIACGFDVHRAQITFDLVDHETGELRRGRIAPATREQLRVWLAAVETTRLVVAVEGTTGWRFVAEEVEAAGARAVLAEPGETRALRGRKRRAKTDRADARWLRELLERGELPLSWIPPEHLLELRCQVRLRQTLADERRAWLQRVHAQLFHHGIPVGGELAQPAGREWLETVALSPAARSVVMTALATVDFLDTQLAALDDELRRYARAHPATQALGRLYGVGALTAVAIYAAIGDARRFSSARKVIRLAGLDVTVHESAGKRQTGRISRQGPPMLRWAAYEAGLAACRRSSPDHADYLALRDRLGHKTACLTISRRVLRRAYHALVAVGDATLKPIPA